MPSQDVSQVALQEELSRLDAEITRLEMRLIAADTGITDSILLEATRRTRATTAQSIGLRSAMGWTTRSVPPRRTLTMAAVNVSGSTLWDRPRTSIAAP